MTLKIVNYADKIDFFCGKFCAVLSSEFPDRAVCEISDMSNGNVVMARKGDMLDLQSLIVEVLKHMGDSPVEVHQVLFPPR